MEPLNRYQTVKAFALSVALCLVVIGLDFSLGLRPLRGVLEKILIAPLTKVEQLLSLVEEPYQLWQQLNQGRQPIVELETLLANQAVDAEKLKTLEAENEFLRSSTFIARSRPGVLSSLTVRGDSVWLKAGQHQAVTEHMWVLGEKGALIGRVSKSGRSVSLLETPISPTFALPAATSNDTAHGIVTGDGVAAYLTNIAQGDQIAIGDVVVSSGGEHDAPLNIPIGVVSHIMGTEAQVIKKAKLELLLKPHTNMIVRVE